MHHRWPRTSVKVTNLTLSVVVSLIFLLTDTFFGKVQQDHAFFLKIGVVSVYIKKRNRTSDYQKVLLVSSTPEELYRKPVKYLARRKIH